MYKYFNKNCIVPISFQDLFTFNSSINVYTTRNSNKLLIPFLRYTFSRTVIRYKGAIMWNNLPDDLKNSFTLSCFKSKLKLRQLASY